MLSQRHIDMHGHARDLVTYSSFIEIHSRVLEPRGVEIWSFLLPPYKPCFSQLRGFWPSKGDIRLRWNLQFGIEEHTIGAVLRAKFSPIGEWWWVWEPSTSKFRMWYCNDVARLTISTLFMIFSVRICLPCGVDRPMLRLEKHVKSKLAAVGDLVRLWRSVKWLILYGSAF